MTALFGTILLVGVLGLLVWVVATGVAHSVDGWGGVDPETRFGRVGRSVLAAFLGFGMAGMSASYADWSPILALIGALAGATALVTVGFWFGPTPTSNHASRR
ncbi:MAG: hypothetical protein BMS9Abin17_1260 [Acidimicrobiia bacterium]|nr:MAG: hypothetical protein BMS9Abin17_1260 [Acidimicrobiia bacterium]